MWAHYLNSRNKKNKHLMRMVVLTHTNQRRQRNEKIDQFSKLSQNIHKDTSMKFYVTSPKNEILRDY